MLRGNILHPDRSVLGPALRNIEPEDLIHRVLAQAGIRVAKQAKLTEMYEKRLVDDHESVYDLLQKDRLSYTDVQQSLRDLGSILGLTFQGRNVEGEKQLAAQPFIELLLNTRAELRQAKQFALADLVYPGAVHTRFEHSIGTMHVAGLLANQLVDDEESRRLVRLCALLHDVGHGPFSHVSEDLLDRYYDSSQV